MEMLSIIVFYIYHLHETEIDSNYAKALHNSSYVHVVKLLFKNKINFRVNIILFHWKDRRILFIIRFEKRELL